MQIKTTMRFYLTTIRIIAIKNKTKQNKKTNPEKKTENNKHWRECGEIGTHVLCWWECKMVQLLWKTIW